MSTEVKRYDAVHIRYEDNNIRYGEGCEIEVVTAADYEREVMIAIAAGLRMQDKRDALHAEAEALRAENAALRAKQGERQEAVVYAVHAKGAQVDHHCPLVSPDMAADYLPGCATPLYTSPQPGPDVRGLVSADDVRDACANAVSVFAEETNADQCREVAEYMREVLLAQIDRRQAQRQA